MVQTQRRRVTSRNPLKALAARTDIKSEYTEIKTGVAERVMRTINTEKSEFLHYFHTKNDCYEAELHFMYYKRMFKFVKWLQLTRGKKFQLY